uniref:Uncharacterized protein n=1 Tax=Anguilla anguilla TaxID=7936 RepID=A0A0E9R1S1_ANGAN
MEAGLRFVYAISLQDYCEFHLLTVFQLVLPQSHLFSYRAVALKLPVLRMLSA